MVIDVKQRCVQVSLLEMDGGKGGRRTPSRLHNSSISPMSLAL